MTKLIGGLSLCIFLSLVGCDNSTDVFDPPVQIPDSVRTVLHKDAIIIAHNNRVAIEGDGYFFDSLYVPHWAIDSIEKALIAVWMHKSSERDSIVNLYKITAGSDLDFHSVIAYKPIDSIKYAAVFARYALDLVDSNQFFFTYRSDSVYNTWGLRKAIREQLDNEDNITLEPLRIGNGDTGDQISASFEGESIILAYDLGYGDCFAGCIHHRVWSFKVSGQHVEFQGVTGDPPCDPITRK
jgi:hypothetical protein